MALPMIGKTPVAWKGAFRGRRGTSIGQSRRWHCQPARCRLLKNSHALFEFLQARTNLC